MPANRRYPSFSTTTSSSPILTVLLQLPCSLRVLRSKSSAVAAPWRVELDHDKLLRLDVGGEVVAVKDDCVHISLPRVSRGRANLGQA
eukprot:624082-Hanusia_phi.AAC.9